MDQQAMSELLTEIITDLVKKNNAEREVIDTLADYIGGALPHDDAEIIKMTKRTLKALRLGKIAHKNKLKEQLKEIKRLE